MDTCNLLNQLIAIHARSLPVYLTDASPWMSNEESQAKDVLNIIAADNELTVDRLAELVLKQRGSVSPGAFPMEFTGMHDLSLDYLVTKLVDYQRRDVNRIQHVVNQLSARPRN